MLSFMDHSWKQCLYEHRLSFVTPHCVLAHSQNAFGKRPQTIDIIQ